jgi:hypothetical protein
MKKLKYILLFILSLNLIISCGKSKKEIEKKTEEKNYIFFLHNKFVEENDIEVEHPEYGKAEYSEIIK